MADHPKKSNPIEKERLLIEQYRILSDRRINHDSLLWQTPVLFFTAQAFLYNIALGSGNWWSRAIAAFISFLFSLLTGLLFDNNRAMEITDAEQALDIENYLISNCKHTGLVIHTKPRERDYLEVQKETNSKKVQELLLKRNTITTLNLIPSFYIWQCGFRLIAYISAFIFLYILVGRLTFLATIPSEISINIKVIGVFFCALETIMLLFQKALFPVYAQFEETICKLKCITIILICLQNIVLIILLIIYNSSLCAYLAVILISNFVPALSLISIKKHKDKKREDSNTAQPSVSVSNPPEVNNKKGINRKTA